MRALVELRPLRRLGLVLAIPLLLAGLAAAPAQAHAELESTNPADGSSISAPPENVVLTFGEELVPETVNVAISDAGGPLDGITPRTDGAVVTVPWPAEVGDGDYTVAFRVVSQDGHPVEGIFAFTVAAGAASAPATPAVASGAPDQGASAIAVAPPVGSPIAAPTQEAPYEPTGPEDGSIDWTLVVVVMAFGVAAFAALLVAGRKNARRKW